MTSLTEAEVRELFKELGSIKARLDAGAENHIRFERQIGDIKDQLAPLPSVVETVKKMEPIVHDYERNKWKAAGVFLVISVAVGAVVSFAKDLFHIIKT